MRISKSLVMSLFTSLLLVYPASAKSLIDKTKDKGKDFIKNFELKKSVNLVDVSLIDGLSNSLKYTYQVQPSYIKDLYTRVDKLGVNTNISPLTLLGVNSPLRFNIIKNSEIVFVSQHDSQIKAATQIPKVALLNKLPTSAQKAINNLTPGDFVSLNAQLNLVFSASVAASQGWITAGASTHYSLKGSYNIRVYRLKEDRLRIQLIALKKKAKGIHASIKVGSGFEIMGFDLVDDKINDFIKFDLIKINATKSSDNLFLVDYVVDLKSPKVQQAYNSLIDSSLDIRKLQNLEAIDPTSAIRNLRRNKSKKETEEYDRLKMLLKNNIMSFESIMAEDSDLPESSKRVRQIFKGQNRSKSISTNIQYGLNFVKFKDGKIHSDNHMAVEQADGSKDHYFFPTRVYIDEEELLFGYFKEQEYHNINALFKESENKKDRKFVSFGYYYTRTDKTFLAREQSRNRKELLRQIPYNQFLKIGWKDWYKSVRQSNARLTTEIYFNADLLAKISSFEYSRREFELLLKEHFNLIRDRNAKPTANSEISSKKYCISEDLKKSKLTKVRRGKNTGPSHMRTKRRNIRTQKDYIAYYAGDICLMANKLHHIFSTRLDSQVRVKLFLGLEDSKLFKNMGLGFVLSLIKPDNREQNKYFRVKVKWSADDIAGMNYDSHKYFSPGQADFNRELYQSILGIQSVLNNRKYDLRLIEDIVSEGN